jgi:hypothetical protein
VANYHDGLNFNGTSQYISANNTNITSSAYSISAWIWVNGTAIDQVFFSMGTAFTTSNNIHLRLDSPTTMTFGQYGDDLSLTINNVTTGWNHIVVTMTAAKLGTMYQNGVANATTRTFTNLFGGNNNWSIGRWNATAGSFFPGYIDDVRVYNKALSASEVLDLYNNRSVTSSLLSFWSLDQVLTTSAGTVKDSSGNGNNGTEISAIPIIGGITKLQPQYQLAPFKFFTGTALQNFLTYWDSSDWSTTNAYVFQGEANNNSTSVIELDTSGGTQVTNSVISTIDNRATSTSMCMPSTGNLDTKATTNNSDIYSARILVDVGGTAASCGDTPTTAPNLSRFLLKSSSFKVLSGKLIIK